MVLVRPSCVGFGTKVLFPKPVDGFGAQVLEMHIQAEGRQVWSMGGGRATKTRLVRPLDMMMMSLVVALGACPGHDDGDESGGSAWCVPWT